MTTPDRAVEPSRPAVEGDWPVRARVLRAHARSATVASGRPVAGGPVVTSLRVVGVDWWAVWEDGRFHTAFTPAGMVNLTHLVGYVVGGA